MLPSEENVGQVLIGKRDFLWALSRSQRGSESTVEFIRRVVMLYESSLDSIGISPEDRQNRLNGANTEAEEEVRRLTNAQ
jgi:hypothetical protein